MFKKNVNISKCKTGFILMLCATLFRFCGREVEPNETRRSTFPFLSLEITIRRSYPGCLYRISTKGSLKLDSHKTLSAYLSTRHHTRIITCWFVSSVAEIVMAGWCIWTSVWRMKLKTKVLCCYHVCSVCLAACWTYRHFYFLTNVWTVWLIPILYFSFYSLRRKLRFIKN